MRNIFSRVKGNGRNQITKIKNGVKKFKEDFSEAKSQPRSKRKSFLLGVTTVVGIFGVTLLAPVLPALAKDLPKDLPKNVTTPADTPESVLLTSEQLIKKLSSAAAVIAALAAGSASYVIGAGLGLIIVVGILKAEGK